MLRPRLWRGKITKLLSKYCDFTIGLDIKFQRFLKDTYKIEYIIADARRLPIRQSTIDFVTAISLLEHVPGWWQIIKQVSKILRISGTFIIQLPNLKYIIEPHTKIPLLALMPNRIRYSLAQSVNYGDLQFDCILDKVLKRVRENFKIVGIIYHYHIKTLSNILPAPSYIIIALANSKTRRSIRY